MCHFVPGPDHQVCALDGSVTVDLSHKMLRKDPVHYISMHCLCIFFFPMWSTNVGAFEPKLHPFPNLRVSEPQHKLVVFGASCMDGHETKPPIHLILFYCLSGLFAVQSLTLCPYKYRQELRLTSKSAPSWSAVSLLQWADTTSTSLFTVRHPS